MISGSVISNNVGSLLFYGIKAIILVSPRSACAVFVIAGTEAILGEIAISEPLEDSYLVIAI